jgi:c-di-GMP-related signal transduction protein
VILKPLPLEKDIVDAVLYQKGELGDILRCVLEYEQRHWEGAQAAVQVSKERIEDAYRQSLTWSLSTINAFAEAGRVTR